MKKIIVIFIAVLAALAVALPALAGAASPSYTFSVGARILTDIGWQQKSKELTANGSSNVGSWFVNQPGVSYLQARFYSVDKTVGGRIELGLKSINAKATTSLRYAYGYWRIGKFRILAGQTDNWFGGLAYHAKQYVGINLGHALMFGWGYLWPQRTPQVQFTYDWETVSVQFAMEGPRQNTNYFASEAETDTKYIFPRATLTLLYKNGGFMSSPGISFVKHSYEGGDTGAFDDSYTTWAVVFPIKFTTGAFTMTCQAHYGINFATEYWAYPTTWTSPYRKGITSGEIEDTTIYGGMLSGEYKLFSKLSIVSGFGFERFSNDAWNGKNGFSEEENTRWGVFVGLPYQATKQFGVHAELAHYNYGDSPKTGEDMGKEWIIGMQFRFVF